MDEYKLRKDIDSLTDIANQLSLILEENEVANLQELLGRFYDKSEVDVDFSQLSSSLDVLYDDLIDFKTTLLALRSSLIDFNGELISFDADNDNLAGDLTKLKDNLHLFTGAVKTLSGHLTDLQGKADELGVDLWGEGGLDERLTSLGNVVGDDGKGLVKGLNDLSDGLDKLNDDVFGTNGLDASVTGLLTAVGDNNSGLIHDLNELNNDVFGEGGLSDDIFGTNGLSSQLSDLSDTINDPTTGLSVQVTGLDNRVFGEGGLNDSIFGDDGLANRMQTAEGGLSELTYNLDTLGDYLSAFEDDLDDFIEELDNNPDIDTSKLNNTMIGLIGAVNIVKNNVVTTQGQLDGVSDSFDNVKTNLYGTKTVDGETVPKEPTDTADATSLRGHLTTLKDTTVPAVQTTLYGGEGNSPSNPATNSVMGKANAVQGQLYGTTGGVPNTPETASQNSFKSTLEHLRDTTVPDVSQTATAAKTAGITLKSDLYGTKTVDGKTVPREPSEASSTSFKTTLEDLRDTTVPAVQGEIFGTDSQGNPLNSDTYSSDSLLGKSDEIKIDMFGSKTVDGKTVPKDSTDTPDANSFRGLMNTVTQEDIPLVKNITYGEGEYYIDETTHEKVYYDEDNPSPTSSLGLAKTVDAGLTTANGHITNIQNMSYGADQINPATGNPYTIDNPAPNSVSGLTNTAIRQIGDENTSGTILHDITQAQTDISNAQSDIGTVNRSSNGSLQTQILNAPVLLDYLYCALYPYPERQQIHAGVNESVYVVAYLSNVGRRVIPNGSSLEFTIIAPDNTVTTQTVVRQNQLPNVGIWTSFSQVGDYKIMCCNLSYTLKVGDVSDNWVDKTSDLNQNVAPYCKFEINPSLKLAVINYTRDDLTIPSSGTQSVLGIPTDYCPIGNNYVQLSSTLTVRLNKKTAQVNAGGFTFLNSGSSTTPNMDFEILYRYR